MEAMFPIWMELGIRIRNIGAIRKIYTPREAVRRTSRRDKVVIFGRNAAEAGGRAFSGAVCPRRGAYIFRLYPATDFPILRLTVEVLLEEKWRF